MIFSVVPENILMYECIRLAANNSANAKHKNVLRFEMHARVKDEINMWLVHCK